ncbi:hypothetical protein ADUPG1_003825, partial [Aduncisulcus paluster]
MQSEAPHDDKRKTSHPMPTIQRHHDLRRELAKQIRLVKSHWSVEEEVTRADGLRDDIIVNTGTNSFWMDITVVYEDATLGSVEERMKQKEEKYGENGSAIVLGHSGLMATES